MFALENMKHLASYKAKVTRRIDFGETPIGQRVDVYFEGELTGEALSGKMEGIDYVSTRSDGTMEIHVRAAITTSDGTLISVQISGYFSPKDGSIKDNHVQLLTSHEKYKWLCDKIVVGRGKGTTTPGGEEGISVDYYYEP